jgi:hypothetical protein
VGDFVYLKVSPTKGVQRFGIKGKLAPHYIRPYEIREACGPVAYESRLEGVDRQNLKIIKLSTHYKPELALERILSPGERGKQINQEIMRMNTVICFTEVRF